MENETTIRARLTDIISDFARTPALNASMLAREYAQRHGIEPRVHEIAGTLLAEMFDPAVRLRNKG